MQRQDTSIDQKAAPKRRKVVMFTIAGLVVGLCVGYTLAKFAHWLMSIH